VSSRFDTDYSSASTAENQPKNRYQNVLPPEETRVKLEHVEDQIGSDYINANFINGIVPGSERAYVASQGPTATTLSDFWRMVWELNASVILMLTKEVENGRLKCSKYWPEPKEPEKYEQFELSHDDLTEDEETTKRIFTLKNMKNEQVRKVTQFQYNEWPDHGVPISTKAFLSLAQKAVNENKSNSPIIIHCSAGIGRTGTFCTIHSILEKLKLDLKENPNEEPTVNICQVIWNIRKQRSNMVQTVEQYQFCYMAIADGAKDILKEFDDNKKKD